MKTGNIGIRNLADIGVSDIDVYGTNKRKKYLKLDFKGNLQFYRSKSQVQDKLGTEDTLYTGQFGFDTYREDICPRGSYINYLDLDGNPIENGKKPEYICPYLSIWPPKTDKTKSKVFLYVKAKKSPEQEALIEYECKEWNNTSKDFTKSTTKLNVKKESFEVLDDKKYFRISVECLDAFENDISILAKYGEKPVGRIIVKANSKIYETEIQPVLVQFENVTTDKLGVLDKHESFIEKLFNEFKNSSFNQSYIKANLAQKTQILTLKKSDFANLIGPVTIPEDIKKDNPSFKDGNYITGTKENYNRTLERRLAYLTDKENEKRQNLKNQISTIIKNIANSFKSDFNYGKEVNLEKAKSFYENKTATNGWNKSDIKNYILEYENLKKDYTGEVFLNKKNKIYIYYSKDVEGIYRPPVDIVQAFSLLESCTCHIFNNALSDEKSLKLIIHELGHSFGLHHTFPDWTNEGIKDAKKNILDKKTEKKALEETYSKASAELRKYFGIDRVYREINSVVNAEDLSKVSPAFFESYFISFFTGKYRLYENGVAKDYTENCEILKIEDKQMVLPQENPIQNKQKEIDEQEKELKDMEAAVLTETIAKGKTLENYMDYRQTSGGDFKEKFEYKSYFHWQWAKIIKFVSTSISFKESK